MITELFTRSIRRYLVGKEMQFTFTPAGEELDIPRPQKTGVYIHIPFCRSLCPYCPYNKIPYHEKWVRPYVDALLAEIDRYSRQTGPFEISSIYIGGGTPTTLIKELAEILRFIRERFGVSGDICMETIPSDLGRDTVKALKDCGVDLVSVGVQSFNEKYLRMLGRNYGPGQVHEALDLVLQAGFKSVNLDLMFALPGQTVEEMLPDLRQALASGADQVTAYPLFSFPYSTVGKLLRLQKIKMPNLAIRRKMYRALHEYCLGEDLQRVSVWGFSRGNVPRYSSVTRDCYFGWGAGSGSCQPGIFYLNTFSVEEYIRANLENRSPVAVKMDLTDRMNRYYWLYWRFYDTFIPGSLLASLFGEDRQIQKIRALMKILKLAEETGEGITLNERGAFWLHLLQNYFSLNYVNKIWSAAKEDPWPGRISL